MKRMERRKYFRLFLVFGLLLTLAAAIAGCGEGQSREKDASTPVVIDISALSSQLQKELGLVEELSPVEGEVFSYVYDVAPENYQQAVLLLSTGAAADEIRIVQAADEDSKKAIKKQMEARIGAQKESFASYLPEEAAKLDKALIKEIDDYLIFVVCDSPEQAEIAIQQAIESAN